MSERTKWRNREPTKSVLQIQQLGNGTEGPAGYGWSSRKWLLQEKSQEVGGAKNKTPHETLTVNGGGPSLTLKHCVWALTRAFAVKSLSRGITLSLHSIRTVIACVNFKDTSWSKLWVPTSRGYMMKLSQKKNKKKPKIKSCNIVQTHLVWRLWTWKKETFVLCLFAPTLL